MVIKMNFLSKHLGMQTNITVCLPTFSFADVMEKREEVYVKGMKYQNLYLLHGGSGDDFALPRCRAGYEALTELGFKTHFLEVPGYKHEWDFWDMILRKAISEWLPIKHKVIYPEDSKRST